MPVHFDDAAQHAASLPNLSDRIAAFLSTIRSRLQQVDGNDAKAALLADLDQHHDLMVRTVVGDGNAAAVGYRGRLGPGETPIRAGDAVMSHDESERHGNPTAPYDASGHKVHPADAMSNAARTDPARGAGFGGNGMGAGADVRSQAALAAQDQPLESMQEQTLVRPAPNRTAAGGRIVPVVRNEIVPGSEVTRDGIRYVTKQRADGSTYQAVDSRPVNEPV